MLRGLVFGVVGLASAACAPPTASTPWSPGAEAGDGAGTESGTDAEADGGAAESDTSADAAPDDASGSTGGGLEPGSTGAPDEGSTGDAEPGPLVGPESGRLLVHGGGSFSAGFTHFIELAGGPQAAIVVIPTALPDGNFEVDNPGGYESSLESNWGLSDVTVIHTRDPALADTEAFAAPLMTADAVWFGGGRQWRFVDAYAGTRTEEEIREVLARDGVIGGSSAGASIQGSFLVRGDTQSNLVVIGDHTVGFGYLQGVGIDQHVAQRDREYDLFEVLELDPSILGLGLDEATWIVAEGDELECFGPGTVYVHDVANWAAAGNDDEKILWLAQGDRYDMGLRQLLP